MSAAGKKRATQTVEALAEWHNVESWSETLLRFITAEHDDPDAKAVAGLLASMWNDAKLGKAKWNDYMAPLGLRKLSGALNPSDDFDAYRQAVSVVYRYMAYGLTEKDALDEIQKIAPIGDRAAAHFIEKHRDEALRKMKVGDVIMDDPANFHKVERLRPAKRDTQKK